MHPFRTINEAQAHHARDNAPLAAHGPRARLAKRAVMAKRAAMARSIKALRALQSAVLRSGQVTAHTADRATDSDTSTVQPLPFRKRAALLAAAIAVPAMAAPGGFGALPGDAPTEAERVNARLAAHLAANPAMPFEKPGESFPGSAFFFLEDPDENGLTALPTTNAFEAGTAEAGRELGALIDTGPAARPFFGAGGISQMRAQECLAQAIWYEAASESESGQRAVAQVVLNRVAHPSWPGSVCGVVYQGSQRSTGCQFTFTCDGSLSRRASGPAWQRARRIAADALAGSVYAPVGHATHYHTLWVNPYWASSLDHVGTIGAHRFYRNRGAAGEKSAFSGGYSGFEPGIAGRETAPPAAARDMPNAAIAGGSAVPGAAFGAAPAAASAHPVIAAQPVGAVPPPSAAARSALTGSSLADPALKGVGQVRSDYANAGQWKSDAARANVATENRAKTGNAAP